MLSWSASTARYRNDQGRFLSREAVITARDAIVRDTIKQLDTLTIQLKSRAINLAEWQLSTKDVLRAAHTLAFGIASGGKANITQSDWGRLGAITRQQYERLNRMANRIENGGIIHRGWISQYAKAVRATFLIAEKSKQAEIGKTIVRWIRTAKESCVDCIANSEHEWTIETVPTIGSDTRCGSSCKCFYVYE